MGSLIFKAIDNLEIIEVFISFSVDYFLHYNINNLIDLKRNISHALVIDETNEKEIFEIINGSFTFYMMNLLRKSIVMKRLKKINQIELEAANENEALEVLRQNLEPLNIEQLNEKMYEIKKKHENLFFAYPNKEGLEFMIKITIPQNLIVLLGEGRVIRFAGKSLIGGKIAVKNFSIEKIKKKLLTLIKMESKFLEKEASQNDEKNVIEEEKAKPEINC